MMKYILLVVVGLFLTACGGRPRLVVELGAPVEMTEKRSSGFDPELATDNEGLTFMNEPLPSSTVFSAYEDVEVLARGQTIWSMRTPIEASIYCVRGTVVKTLILYRPQDIAGLQAIGNAIMARFGDWEETGRDQWSSILREFDICMETKETKTEVAGGFAHPSGVHATALALCTVNPRSIDFGVNLEFELAEPGR